jgi:hypothetical protein
MRGVASLCHCSCQAAGVKVVRRGKFAWFGFWAGATPTDVGHCADHVECDSSEAQGWLKKKGWRRQEDEDR